MEGSSVFCFANLVGGFHGNTEGKCQCAVWILSPEFSSEIWANIHMQPQNSS